MGVALSIFGTVTKLLNVPLLSVTTNIVATAVGSNRGELPCLSWCSTPNRTITLPQVSGQDVCTLSGLLSADAALHPIESSQSCRTPKEASVHGISGQTLLLCR